MTVPVDPLAGRIDIDTIRCAPVRVAEGLGLSVQRKGKDVYIQCPSRAHEDQNPSCHVVDGQGLRCRLSNAMKNRGIKIITALSPHDGRVWLRSKGVK